MMTASDFLPLRRHYVTQGRHSCETPRFPNPPSPHVVHLSSTLLLEVTALRRWLRKTSNEHTTRKASNLVKLKITYFDLIQPQMNDYLQERPSTADHSIATQKKTDFTVGHCVQLVVSLGLTLFRALDYGLCEDEERTLSPGLERLIDRMTCAEPADEGIGEEEDEVPGLAAVMEVNPR
ncbi:SPIRE2 [Cordylochernes scorpioides]|uniref:SPIRE2 n=1 Tax=Cordylochernes scorpioides TaxID=51811 RepID=A0ABY6K6T4_9ARAC|nr:SPIRE2 [Cordylochernes scorpioides]